MKLFEYAVIYNPKDKAEKSKILVNPTVTLASNADNAKVLAARAIPEDYLGRLDQVEVAVRPF